MDDAFWQSAPPCNAGIVPEPVYTIIFHRVTLVSHTTYDHEIF